MDRRAFLGTTFALVACGGGGGGGVTTATAAVVAGTVKMSIHALGDSIPTGAGASNPANGFVALLASALGASIDNSAHSTDMAMDQFEALVARTFAPGEASVLMLGTNDQAKYDVDPAKRGYYIDAMRSFAMRTAANYKEATPANGVTFTGAWGTGYAWGCAGASAAGARATFVTTGPVVLIESLRQVANTGTFRVTIDGVVKGPFSCGGDVTTIWGRKYGPQCLAFAGLGPGPHTVQIDVLSADASNVVFLKAFSDCSPKARAVFVNIPHAIAYTYGGSSANVDAYNAALAALVAEMANYGLDVRLVNCNAVLTPADMADNVHPNDAGHLKIKNLLVPALAGVMLGSAGIVFDAAGNVYVSLPGGLRQLVTC